MALVESPEWERATRAIEVTARRCGPSWLRDDVVSETRVRLLASVAAGVQIESLCAYAMQVVRSVVRILCAQESPPGVDADSVASAPRPPSFDELVLRPGLPGKFLRGAVQNRIVDEVRAGHGLEAISEVTGLEVRETRRQVKRLAAEVLRRRRGHADFRAESPRSDSP